MKETTIIEKKKIKRKLNNAILITGLPGIGLVGQVAVRYILQKLKPKKIATIFSPYFSHHVFMTKKGAMRLVRNYIYFYNSKQIKLLILTGDVQAVNSTGQYEVAGSIIDYVKKLGVKKIITIGGYSTGKIKEEKRVFGVVTHKHLVEEFKKVGVVFGEAKGAIVGAAGLLPTLGKLKGLEGACLMGETHGNYVDTASASKVLEILSKYLGVTIDLDELKKQAKESEKVIKKVEEELKKTSLEFPSKDVGSSISYIR